MYIITYVKQNIRKSKRMLTNTYVNQNTCES